MENTTMENTNATPANEPARPTITDCHTSAIILSEMLEGIDLMNNEGAPFDNARIATTIAAVRFAKQLADDLDGVKA